MKKHLLVLLGAACLFAAGCSDFCPFKKCAAPENVVKFDDFYKDGDDGLAAMAKILELVKSKNGAPTVVEFSSREYDFKKSPLGYLFGLENIKNLTIDGRGAKILIDPYNSFCRILKCENVALKNMDTSYSSLSFTQGEIVAVDKEKKFFVLRVQEGYPLLPSDEFTKKTYVEGWRWGSVIDPKIRSIKFGTIDAVFMQKIEPAAAPREYRIYPETRSRAMLGTVAVGDRYAMPVYGEPNPVFGAAGAGHSHISIVKSSNILIENLKASALKHMGFGGSLNTGAITFRNCSITWRNGSDLISSWRDGIHFKQNKVGPAIENCRIEGLLDDSINFSAAPTRIVEELGGCKYKVIRAESMFAGCPLGIYYADTGKWVEGVKVVSIKNGVLETDKPIPNVVKWIEVSAADINNSTAAVHKNKGMTGLYNLEYLNAGFRIRKNYFGLQRRYAAIIRSHDGVIEDNVLEGLPAGILISNEIGGWYEGAIPYNIKISRNEFKGIWRTPLAFGMQSVSGARVPECANFEISGNKFYLSGNKPQIAVRVGNGKDYVFKGNEYFLGGKPLKESDAVEISPKASDVSFK